MSSESKRRLIVFAREPEKGKVKTRLLKTFSHRFVLEFYKASVQDVLKTVKKANCRERVIYYTGRRRCAFLKRFAKGFRFERQYGADLGARMFHAFKRSFREGAERVVIIGTDSPLITVRLIEGAFKALEGHDLVLAPCYDGGYGLIGLKQEVKSIFRGIRWGSSRVLAKTLKKAQDKRLKVKILEEMEDIDRPEDLKALRRNRRLKKTSCVCKFLKNNKEMS